MNPNLSYNENYEIERRLRRNVAIFEEALKEIANMEIETGHDFDAAKLRAKEALDAAA